MSGAYRFGARNKNNVKECSGEEPWEEIFSKTLHAFTSSRCF